MNGEATLIRGTLGDNEARFFALDSKSMVIKARETHDASYTAATALGRLISAGAMLSQMMKNKNEGMTITINGGGIGGSLICSCKTNGLVKAYVSNPRAELPLNDNKIFDVGGFVGTDGRISVMRDSLNGQPYTGQCELQTGEIAEDLAYYFLKSEQIPSLVSLGVLIKNDEIISAGGIIIQALPDCSPELIEALELRSMLMSDISRQLEVMSIEQYTTALFDGLNMRILDTIHPYYGCDCSRERTEKALLSMGKDELLDMAKEDKGAHIKCSFCSKEYSFREEDIYNLLDQSDTIK